LVTGSRAAGLNLFYAIKITVDERRPIPPTTKYFANSIASLIETTGGMSSDKHF